MFSYLTWDPSRVFFVVPYINHPITWYGLLFATGFLIAYFLVRHLFLMLFEGEKEGSALKAQATLLTDRLALVTILGTIIGARLGHVFFYGWSYYRHHLIDIFKVWEGGLASHGGALGIFLGLLIFYFWNRKTFPKLTFLTILDIIVIPTAFVGGCIRLGNFINQEIVGTPTSLPWGVIFLHPVDGPPGIPLHPSQLYESLFYFLLFALLFCVWKRTNSVGKGLLSALFFLLLFSFRFFIEMIKPTQSDLISNEAWFNMGQLLSLPFIVLGALLLCWYCIRRKRV